MDTNLLIDFDYPFVLSPLVSIREYSCLFVAETPFYRKGELINE